MALRRELASLNVGRLGGLASVALAFGCGAIVARALLAHAPARTLIDRAQPLVVVTAWGPFGVQCFWVLAATLAVATLTLILAVFRLAGRIRADDRVGYEVAIAAGAAIAATFAWPFVFSSDVYAYAAYGAMALHGLNPYALTPAHVHGAIIDAARFQWSGTYPVCVYGPLFVAPAAAVVAVTSVASVSVTLWVFRVLAAAAFVGSILALDLALRRHAPTSRFVAVAAYGLNPVALWTVAEGHNDAFVLLLASAAVALGRRRSPPAGALLVGLSAAVKATGALYAGAVIVAALRSAAQERKRGIVGGAVGGLLLAAIVTLPPLLSALEAVGKNGRYAPAASLQSLVGIGPALAVALAAAAYGIARVVRRDRDGYAWCGIALWLALPDVYPWYALWVLPAVIVSGGGYAAAALWGATIFSAVRYLPDAAGTLSGADRWIAAAAVLPLLGALRALIPPRLKKATLPS